MITLTFRLLSSLSLAMHQEKTSKRANQEGAPEGAVPAYLIDREGVSRAKVRREWDIIHLGWMDT